MGVSDRDWYIDKRRARPSAWGGENSAGRLWAGLTIIAAVVICTIYTARHWTQRNQVLKTTEAPVYINISPEASPAGTTGAAPQITTSVTQQPAVFKCIVNGRVIYSGPLDCRGSMPTQVPIANASPRQEGEPSGLSDYQIEMLRSADRRIARDEAAAKAEMAVRQSLANTSHAECDALAQEIKSLDAWARRPLSGSEQDTIRARRQQATSRQFGLHC